MTWRLGLALALFLVMVATSAWWSGREAGLAEGRAQCAEAQAGTYRDVLEQSVAQLRKVQDASAAIFQRLAQRADSDQQTTRELRHALAETAADRAACRFPAGVMQQLETARQRAAHATTSGLGATLSDPGGGDG
ncbi:hypothetical protein [Pseudomonas aeruginosa]|uniref:hypothetical protein n=1 Tax=Pseudomonas aeruginosa TaxID=287 RepID=UPI0015B86B96|nr:hypothetical protein [Pseudomonas aeruginosa]EKW5974346.1 hypothetical protein [Pseudomonas aeruginosa]EMB5660451.1 hypothetical protein [Pseudomonas aeruginosa]MBX6202720.1 hypothetical protein [Pseudomonas aeruginosa]MBX6760757.1 hypothetical protein [Pseudomonas aeruginosa]MCT5895758.1 hypothetical protein [Pseudomonas aeruginosa]